MNETLNENARQLGLLFKFARKMNELDFAGSLSGEFRGMQDSGWSTTITAEQVFEELSVYIGSTESKTVAEIRVILLLYGQLAEAGGIYESLKNLMGVVEQTPYNLWPFKDLVRVRGEPARVIGPNANATFRDLARQARRIGMIRLSVVFENAFRDDIRNAMFHADYILWNDGLRLRRRNGGQVERLSFEQVSEAVNVGAAFFQSIRTLREAAASSFDPPREITGRFSLSSPMPWTVGFDPQTGGLSISGSSPGTQSSPEFERQELINEYLGGRVFAVFRSGDSAVNRDVGFAEHGFEPQEVDLPKDQFDDLRAKIEENGLWDDRCSGDRSHGLLVLSPWGFSRLASSHDLTDIVGEPEHSITFVSPE